MFYSHEILTSRKHGVATIWLVATLGSRSTLKKVDRKAINQVNVPKACEVIVAPDVPMALRLQSQLLYGVSRVYSQQCGYVLQDAQSAHNSLRQMLKNIKPSSNDLDPDTGRARPDTLLVQDDPAFVPDLALASIALSLDLPELDFTTSGYSSGQSTLISSLDRGASHSGHGSLPAIHIPPSSSGGGSGIGGLGNFDFGGDERSSTINKPPAQVIDGLDLADDDIGFLPDADFGFDADGNIYDIDHLDHITTAARLPSAGPQTYSDSAAIERVRQEHENAQRARAEGEGEFFDMDDLPPIDDPFTILPDAEPFPHRNITADQANARSASMVQQDDESSDHAQAALTRRARAPKVIPLDNITELRHSILSDWNSNYIIYMQKGLEQKANRTAAALAKKNADYWIWGSGIGGIGRNASLLGGFDPLAMFYGEQLMNKIINVQSNSSGQKRTRSDEEAEDGVVEERRVRPRSEQPEESGRGDAAELMMDDDAGLGPIGDDQEDLERGRTAPTPPPDAASHDASSAMPWNLSASQRSSTLLQSRRPGGVTGRVVSASPLMNRGAGIPNVTPQDSIAPSALIEGRMGEQTSSVIGGDLPDMNDDGGGGGGEDYGMTAGLDVNAAEEFERFGASAFVDTQTAEQSQWIRAALDKESNNFLDFVKTACAELDADADAAGSIEFESLLAPGGNSKIVAAQGLLHCLSLASKRLLAVYQEEAFGPIVLSLVA